MQHRPRRPPRVCFRPLIGTSRPFSVGTCPEPQHRAPGQIIFPLKAILTRKPSECSGSTNVEILLAVWIAGLKMKQTAVSGLRKAEALRSASSKARAVL
jgi:hypothetical protein